MIENENPEQVESPAKKEMKTTIDFSTPSTLRRKAYSYEHLKMDKPIPKWNQSSATLRHSASLYSIPRDTRFKDPKINYYDHLKLNYPSSLVNRGTNIGKGNKLKIPQTFSHGICSQTSKCPFYSSQQLQREPISSSKTLRKGKTFGLGWKSYQKSRTPHRTTVHCSDQVKASPGPQHYDAINSGTKITKAIKMHERLMMFTDLNGHHRLANPCPQTYQIEEKWIKIGKRGAAIGYGSKTDFTKQKRQIPGPIYKISGFCEKFNKLKKKNLGKNQYQ